MCIGANGFNTEAKLTQMINLIKSYGSIPILCTTPQLNGATTVSEVNQQIINVAIANGVKYVRFDIATCVDYEISNGPDSTLFLDGLHPNADGYERMYKRVLIDVPEIERYSIT